MSLVQQGGLVTDSGPTRGIGVSRAQIGAAPLPDLASLFTSGRVGSIIDPALAFQEAVNPATPAVVGDPAGFFLDTSQGASVPADAGNHAAEGTNAAFRPTIQLNDGARVARYDGVDDRLRVFDAGALPAVRTNVTFACWLGPSTSEDRFIIVSESSNANGRFVLAADGGGTASANVGDQVTYVYSASHSGVFTGTRDALRNALAGGATVIITDITMNGWGEVYLSSFGSWFFAGDLGRCLFLFHPAGDALVADELVTIRHEMARGMPA